MCKKNYCCLSGYIDNTQKIFIMPLCSRDIIEGEDSLFEISFCRDKMGKAADAGIHSSNY